MTTKHFTILLLVAATLLSSCATDDLNGEGQGIYDPAKVVTFTTASISSRGTPIDDVSQMTDMGVFSSATGTTDWATSNVPNKMFNRKLNYNISGAWEYDGTPVKWAQTTAADRYTFFAYAPYATGVYNASTNATGNGIAVTSTASTAGIPTLTYTVPTACANQPDLMVAVPQYNLRHTGKPVSLQMEHALTCVGFSIAGQGEKITGISIEGVSMTGTLTMDGGAIAWTGLDTPSATPTNFPSLIDPAKLTSGWYETDATMTDITAVNGYLMMIPQTLPAGAKVKITFDSGDPKEIPLTGSWLAGKRVIYSVTIVPDGTITITPDNITLPYVASNGQFSVTCTDGGGAPAPSMAWTLTSNQTWLTMSLSSDGTGASTTLSSTGDKTVYVFATANSSTSANRTALIAMGGATQVTVTQIKNVTIPAGAGTIASGFTAYVGAFWKASQTGERIIRITVAGVTGNFGSWSAFVNETDGNGWTTNDILLTTTPSADAGITYNTSDENPADMNDPANDALYQVTSGSSAVTGTVSSAAGDNIIYFRVGLKTTYTPTPTAPVRYATLVLSYGNPVKVQKIYLRQGEDPDYFVGTDHKWSAYNLTAVGCPSGVTLLSSAGDAVFTEYPSQGGYHFQRNSLRAIHPTETISPWGAWQNIGAFNTSLDPCTKLADPGYGTPLPWTSSGFVPSPSYVDWNLTGTGLGGYYADGWFDRWVMRASTSPWVAKQWGDMGWVSTSGLKSLFFAYIQERVEGTGAWNNRSCYWSGSLSSSNYGWKIMLQNYPACTLGGLGNSENLNRGCAVRCIRYD